MTTCLGRALCGGKAGGARNFAASWRVVDNCPFAHIGSDLNASFLCVVLARCRAAGGRVGVPLAHSAVVARLHTSGVALSVTAHTIAEGAPRGSAFTLGDARNRGGREGILA